MGQAGGFAGEGLVAEPHELVTAATQQHDHEVDFDAGTVTSA